jgi:hypothetical protein
MRLGREVLLAYQSPPPLYFNLAILIEGAINELKIIPLSKRKNNRFMYQI